MNQTARRLVEQLRGEETDSGPDTALVALGAAAVPALVAGLQDPDEDRRGRIAQILGRIRSPAAVEPLLALLQQDGRPGVRVEATRALGVIADRRAAPALAAQYGRDDNPQVRYECLASLGLIGDPANAALLVRETSHPDPYTRLWAIDALCRIGGPDATEPALRLLGDGSQYVRRRVLRRCATALTSPAAQEAVVRHAVHDPDFETTVWARRVIEPRLADPADRDAMSDLIRLVARPLVEEGPPATQEQYQAVFVVAELRDGTVVEQLITALRAPDVLVRHHAAYLLGKSGDARAVPALIEALADPHGLVHGMARETLRGFAARGDAAAAQALAKPPS